MKVLVLGGCGIQGRAALYDLTRNESVDHVTCADIQPELFDSFDKINMAFSISASDKLDIAKMECERF